MRFDRAHRCDSDSNRFDFVRGAAKSRPDCLTIPRQQVQSTAIAAVGYSKRRHILEIEFVNGAIYRYFDMPRAVHRELMSSESKARFYDSNIRRRYRSIPIRPRQKGGNHE